MHTRACALTTWAYSYTLPHSPMKTNLHVLGQCEGQASTGSASYNSCTACIITRRSSPTTERMPCGWLNPGVNFFSFIYCIYFYSEGDTPICWSSLTIKRKFRTWVRKSFFMYIIQDANRSQMEIHIKLFPQTSSSSFSDFFLLLSSAGDRPRDTLDIRI